MANVVDTEIGKINQRHTDKKSSKMDEAVTVRPSRIFKALHLSFTVRDLQLSSGRMTSTLSIPESYRTDAPKFKTNGSSQ